MGLTATATGRHASSERDGDVPMPTDLPSAVTD
jgi:hypothetical protein